MLDFADRFDRLEAWTREHVPSAREIVHRWSGQVMEPVDLAPYIGRNPGNDNFYVATGDSGEGLTTGVVAGMLIADLIDRRDNPWAVAYDPRRISLKSATEYVKENATMVANLAEYLTRGEVASLDQLAPGEGAIVRRGGKKLAAYRDEAGALHVNSAVCTHAGCIIHWNALERCWDCPCHGSQFSIDGEPLTGPAMHRLAPPPESDA